MAYSPSRGLLYTEPPNEEPNRRDADEGATADADPQAPRADGADAASTPADD